MIKSAKAISMAEASEYLKDDQAEAKAFIKNFTKLKASEAKELREKLLALDLIKLNEKHISKIIDILPEDKEESTKILADANLDENEKDSVLDKIKEYK